MMSRSDTDSTLKPNLQYAKSACKLLTITPNFNLLIECFLFKKCKWACITSPSIPLFLFSNSLSNIPIHPQHF